MNRSNYKKSVPGIVIFVGLMAVSLAWAADSPHRVMKNECSDCHNPYSWKSVEFNHQNTWFSLDGVHRKIRCLSCHDISDFSKASPACGSCHTDIHQGKLPWNCERCHTAMGWHFLDAAVAHANTSFPLIGGHANLDCHSCHLGESENEFSFVRSECVNCHRADFDAALNPPHTELGFGLRCDECHQMLAWRSANFARHDSFFPIYGGAHAGKWSTCDVCHEVPGDYSQFSCLNCHEHNQSRMDSRHQGEVGGYVYDSNACYDCHRSGTGGD